MREKKNNARILIVLMKRIDKEEDVVSKLIGSMDLHERTKN